MRGILFDKDAHTALGWQVANPPAEGGEPDPLKWHALLNRFAQEHTGAPIRRFTLARILRPGNCLMAWQLTPGAILAAQLGRLVYLHWGGVPKQAIRLAAMRATLKRAQIVLVNDAVAAQEVKALSGREAVRIPMFIDTEFFSYASSVGRSDFLFCAGSNDRDPEVLLSLARHGWQVVWLVNSVELRKRYEDAHPNLRIVSLITNTELRRLYQTCRVAVMPALRDVHAAGQTTGLEALACGAPVAMSECRASTIFDRLPSVHVVRDNEPAAWLTAVSELACGERQGAATAESRQWVCGHTDSQALLAKLALLLGMPGRA